MFRWGEGKDVLVQATIDECVGISGYMRKVSEQGEIRISHPAPRKHQRTIPTIQPISPLTPISQEESSAPPIRPIIIRISTRIQRNHHIHLPLGMNKWPNRYILIILSPINQVHLGAIREFERARIEPGEGVGVRGDVVVFAEDGGEEVTEDGGEGAVSCEERVEDRVEERGGGTHYEAWVDEMSKLAVMGDSQ